MAQERNSPIPAAGPSTEGEWSQVARYIVEDLDAAERTPVERWIQNEPRRAATIARMQRVWHQAPSEISPDVDAALETTLDRITKPKVFRRAVSAPRRHLWIGGVVAAALLVFAGSLSRWADRTIVHQDRALQVYQTRTREQKRIDLPDGSSMLLAPGTQVSYDADFGRRHRLLHVQGEVLFTVVHSAGAPFMVRAGGIETRVIGTSFVVRRYADEPTTRVVVAAGKVALGGTVLTTGDAARVFTPAGSSNPLARQIEVSHAVNIAAALAWTDGALTFQATSLRDVIPDLRRWYGLQVVVTDPSLLKKSVTASFRDESPDQIVDVLSSILDARGERRGLKITFSPLSPQGSSHVQ